MSGPSFEAEKGEGARKGGRRPMFGELQYSRILWSVCFVVVIFGYGCKRSAPDEKSSSVPNGAKMYQETFKITNTGSVDIAELKIICDGKPTVIKGLKPGQPVYVTITRAEIASFSYEIRYVDGKVVKRPAIDSVRCSSGETQMVIEDGGKMYFR